MPTIKETDAIDHSCPWRDWKECLGERCMAWQWIGPQVERCETDNLVETAEGARPLGEPRLPIGEGWERDGAPVSKSYHRSKQDSLPLAQAQRWIRDLQPKQGCCGRTASDQSYGGW